MPINSGRFHEILMYDVINYCDIKSEITTYNRNTFLQIT